jgi:hypothetical protein
MPPGVKRGSARQGLRVRLDGARRVTGSAFSPAGGGTAATPAGLRLPRRPVSSFSTSQ